VLREEIPLRLSGAVVVVVVEKGYFRPMSILRQNPSVRIMAALQEYRPGNFHFSSRSFEPVHSCWIAIKIGLVCGACVHRAKSNEADHPYGCCQRTVLVFFWGTIFDRGMFGTGALGISEMPI